MTTPISEVSCSSSSFDRTAFFVSGGVLLASLAWMAARRYHQQNHFDCRSLPRYSDAEIAAQLDRGTGFHFLPSRATSKELRAIESIRKEEMPQGRYAFRNVSLEQPLEQHSDSLRLPLPILSTVSRLASDILRHTETPRLSVEVQLGILEAAREGHNQSWHIDGALINGVFGRKDGPPCLSRCIGRMRILTALRGHPTLFCAWPKQERFAWMCAMATSRLSLMPHDRVPRSLSESIVVPAPGQSVAFSTDSETGSLHAGPPNQLDPARVLVRFDVPYPTIQERVEAFLALIPDDAEGSRDRARVEAHLAKIDPPLGPEREREFLHRLGLDAPTLPRIDTLKPIDRE